MISNTTAEETVQIPMSPRYWLALKSSGMKWPKFFGELVDNAFDAGANRVEISVSAKQVEIYDDGNGCDDIVKMLTLGEHYHQSTTSLGKYGIGLKEAAAWMWGDLLIETIKGGVKRTARINWDRFVRQSSWIIQKPTSEQAAANERGTRIIFRNIAPQPPGMDHVRDVLSHMFFPAIQSGRQILIKQSKSSRWSPLTAWHLPPMREMIDVVDSINGKQFRVRAGLVEGGHNKKFGFHVCYGHRVIMPGTSWGAKGRSIRSFCGVVELAQDWTLEKNKMDIADEDMHQLEDRIYSICRDLFDRAESDFMVIRNRLIEGKVTESIRGILRNIDKSGNKQTGCERRDKPKEGEGKKGTVKPKNSGRRRKPKKVHVGGRGVNKISASFRSSSISMEIIPLESEDIGRADIQGNKIILNERHPRIQLHRSNENFDALVDICMSLLAFAAIQKLENGSLPGLEDYQGFVEAVSALCANCEGDDHGVDHVVNQEAIVGS